MSSQAKCPNCGKSVEHEDFAFEVNCPHCKTAFNPLFQDGDVPPLEAMSSSALVSRSDPPAASEFESDSVFQELVEYGVAGSESAPPGEHAVAEPTPTAVSKKRAGTGPLLIATAGPSLEGHPIERYFPPLFVVGDVLSEPPLSAAIEILSDQARKLGANALVDLRWELLPNEAKALVSATPVLYREA